MNQLLRFVCFVDRPASQGNQIRINGSVCRLKSAALPPDVAKGYGFLFCGTLKLRLRLSFEGAAQEKEETGTRKGKAFPHIRRHSRKLRNTFTTQSLNIVTCNRACVRICCEPLA